MKKVTISGYVYELDFGYGDEPSYRIFGSDTQGDEHYTLIGPVEVVYEIPDSFNPTAAKLAALEKEKQAVRAAYLAKVREIEERISKLQALEMTVEA
jgi:hypothetical protein